MSNGSNRDQVIPIGPDRPAPAQTAGLTEMVERTAITGELAFAFLSFVDEHARWGDETAANDALPAVDRRRSTRPHLVDGCRVDFLCVADATLRRRIADERRALLLTFAELMRALIAPHPGPAGRMPTC